MLGKEKMFASLPLASGNSYRGGAVGGAWLLTCPHFYLHLIQELHKEEEVIQRIQWIKYKEKINLKLDNDNIAKW